MSASICPHCAQPYDASHRATGDRVWHPDPCDRWFIVVHRDGVTELRPCEPPTSWPPLVGWRKRSQVERDE